MTEHEELKPTRHEWVVECRHATAPRPRWIATGFFSRQREAEAFRDICTARATNAEYRIRQSVKAAS